LSVSKAIRLPNHEGHQLLFRTELFNTPQFGNPGRSLGTGTFGRITSSWPAEILLFTRRMNNLALRQSGFHDFGLHPG
jgi:hypothetical protein